ncbi:MAG TPA: nuclear transport factor 2 family protein [Acidimicrobiales bacterium]|nr:nuclear transport factor 2 family protein [Acidimicrobiales bacterium]
MTVVGTAAANDALVRSMLSAWERRDSAFILDHLTDDAVYHAMPLRPIVGKAALEPWVRSFERVPPGRLEIHHQVVTGDVVMNERTDRITIEGTEVSLAICAVFEVDDGRLKAWREYFDLAGLQSALRAERPAP